MGPNWKRVGSELGASSGPNWERNLVRFCYVLGPKESRKEKYPERGRKRDSKTFDSLESKKIKKSEERPALLKKHLKKRKVMLQTLDQQGLQALSQKWLQHVWIGSGFGAELGASLGPK